MWPFQIVAKGLMVPNAPQRSQNGPSDFMPLRRGFVAAVSLASGASSDWGLVSARQGLA